MLADELEVETCRLDRLGRLGRRFLAHISAGGKLFRVQDLGPGVRPGTRVRLYLQDQHRKGFLAVALSKQLRIAEFATEVTDGRDKHLWMAGTPARASSAGHPDVWWVRCGEGEILSDGLRVEVNDEKAQWVEHIGAVVNLTGEHLPRLTVDRKTILDWDLSWVRKTVGDCLVSLPTSESLSMSQLWEIQEEFPAAVQLILKRLKEVTPLVPIGSLSERNRFSSENSSARSGFREAKVANTVVRADRVGIDRRDIGILALRGESSFAVAAKVLAGTGWIRNSAVEKYEVKNDFTPFEFALRIQHALRKHGTDVPFRDRLSAWTREGLAIHPFTQAIADPASAADYKAYTRHLRQYQRQRSVERLRAIPSDLRQNWPAVLCGLLVVCVLVGGFWLNPKEATFAVVTAGALVAIVASVRIILYFAGKLE
jgi:hypothetical protein